MDPHWQPQSGDYDVLTQGIRQFTGSGVALATRADLCRRHSTRKGSCGVVGCDGLTLFRRGGIRECGWWEVQPLRCRGLFVTRKRLVFFEELLLGTLYYRRLEGNSRGHL
jgi:hypothetical protein